MFSLEFKTDNAAFADGNASEETAAILERIVKRIRGGQTDGTVADTNGNTVGKWWLEVDDDD